MTCKVNADTTNGLKLTSDTSGAIDLQSNGTTRVSMDASGNVTATSFIGDGSSLTGIAGLPDAIDVNVSAPADSLNIDASGEVGIGTMKSRVVRGRKQYLKQKMQGINELIKRVIISMKERDYHGYRLVEKNTEILGMGKYDMGAN